MSEVSESYHLKTTNQSQVIALMRRAGLPGIVFPPSGIWTTFLPEAEFGQMPNELIAANKGDLAHYIYAEDVGFELTVHRGRTLASHLAVRFTEFVQIDNNGLDIEMLCRIAVEAGNDSRDVREVLGEPADEWSGRQRALVRQLAAALGLKHCEWLTPADAFQRFESLDKKFPGMAWVDAADGDRDADDSDQQLDWRNKIFASQTPGPFAIPAALCGRERNVSRDWQRIARKAFQTMSWDQALAGEKWIQLADAPGRLVLKGPCRWVEGDNVLLHQVLDGMREAHEGSYERMDELVIQGCQSLWFCLGMLCGRFDPRDNSTAARIILERMLKWWTVFVQWDDRFAGMTDGSGPWPAWSDGVLSACIRLGHPSHHVRPMRSWTPDRAARQIRLWLGKQ